MTETLFSFSLWCFITMSIIPLSYSMLVQYQEAKRQTEAHQLVMESLQAYAHEKVKKSGEIIKGNNRYDLNWTTEGEFEKLCVKWGDDNENKVCGYSLSS